MFEELRDYLYMQMLANADVPEVEIILVWPTQ